MSIQVCPRKSVSGLCEQMYALACRRVCVHTHVQTVSAGVYTHVQLCMCVCMSVQKRVWHIQARLDPGLRSSGSFLSLFLRLEAGGWKR